MFRLRILRHTDPCEWGLKTMKKLETKSMVLLKHHLKALKLPTIHAECEKVGMRQSTRYHVLAKLHAQGAVVVDGDALITV